jgi:hypothetical protein
VGFHGAKGKVQLAVWRNAGSPFPQPRDVCHPCRDRTYGCSPGWPTQRGLRPMRMWSDA